ncbi:hypothetical protein [Streptomyces sp. NPDC091371]|uniref:hypothetical protein n=1 Tax=Streptomyces sp. NPDC091371 TaxID=3155303 RepID=UPI00341DE2EA
MNTEHTTPRGTALLLAAAPIGKGRLIDAAGVLPTLAAVPPATLTRTPAGTIVELADPTDQQTVLTRIRAAAAAPGPLTVCLAGQLHLDTKQHLLHVALARATRATLRYTGLPWNWLASELKPRRPGTTTVLVDLIAAPEPWQQICANGLTLGPGIALYGRISPPPPHRRVAEPAYLKAIATTWRSGLNPPIAELHAKAASKTGQDGALFLATDAFPAAAPTRTPPRPTSAAEDPLPAILATAHAGHHDAAASLAEQWESRALHAYGPGSPQAIHWLEVRADLARIAGDPARSCELWMAAADARLALRQHPDDPAVVAPVDRAHHQWQQIPDPQRARELGPHLAALRRHVPGQRPGATQAVQRRLELLDTGAHR